MTNLKLKIASVVGSIVGVMATAYSALADTFGTSTAPTLVNGLITDVAVIIGAVIASILGLLAALMGLGWGVKKFRHYITGKKF